MLKSYFHPTLLEAGLDEAGRGCLAGPVVAAAVILPKTYTHAWLTDSKQLTRRQREVLRDEIHRDALAWAIGEASSTEIDALNVLRATFLAMHRAIDALTIRPECLLVDGNRFAAYPLVPHTCVVRGDAQYLAIAAASVLAKTYRDDRMETLARQHPAYGWEQNAGYPTPAHCRALMTHGPTPHHRRSFRLSYDEAALNRRPSRKSTGF
jgi:ribonuclease HII